MSKTKIITEKTLAVSFAKRQEMFKLRNDYHKTSVLFRGSAYLRPAVVADTRRRLCGVANCPCGGGLSGQQDVTVIEVTRQTAGIRETGWDLRWLTGEELENQGFAYANGA